jgi:hypothetical protein
MNLLRCTTNAIARKTFSYSFSTNNYNCCCLWNQRSCNYVRKYSSPSNSGGDVPNNNNNKSGDVSSPVTEQQKRSNERMLLTTILCFSYICSADWVSVFDELFPDLPPPKRSEPKFKQDAGVSPIFVCFLSDWDCFDCCCLYFVVCCVCCVC